MTRTFTLTNTLARIDAVIFQIDYVLRMVAKEKDENFIKDFLGMVRSQYIAEIRCYAVPHGSRVAAYYFSLKIDWGKHAALVNQDELVDVSMLGDDISPEIIMEARRFDGASRGLAVRFGWYFSERGKPMARQFNAQWGADMINEPSVQGDIMGYSLNGIEEITFRRNVY